MRWNDYRWMHNGSWVGAAPRRKAWIYAMTAPEYIVLAAGFIFFWALFAVGSLLISVGAALAALAVFMVAARWLGGDRPVVSWRTESEHEARAAAQFLNRVARQRDSKIESMPFTAEISHLQDPFVTRHLLSVVRKARTDRRRIQEAVSASGLLSEPVAELGLAVAELLKDRGRVMSAQTYERAAQESRTIDLRRRMVINEYFELAHQVLMAELPEDLSERADLLRTVDAAINNVSAGLLEVLPEIAPAAARAQRNLTRLFAQSQGPMPMAERP